MRALVISLALFSASIALGQSPASTTPPRVVTIRPTPAPIQKDPATPEQVREYFRVVGLEASMKKLMSQMFGAMKASSPPYMPDSFWADMETTLTNFDLVSELVPIYQQYLSRGDMEAVLSFYKTDAGRHLLENQAVMSGEAQARFQAIGRRLGEEVGLRHADEIIAAQKKYEQGLVDKHNPDLILPPDPK